MTPSKPSCSATSSAVCTARTVDWSGSHPPIQKLCAAPAPPRAWCGDLSCLDSALHRPGEAPHPPHAHAESGKSSPHQRDGCAKAVSTFATTSRQRAASRTKMGSCTKGLGGLATRYTSYFCLRPLCVPNVGAAQTAAHAPLSAPRIELPTQIPAVEPSPAEPEPDPSEYEPPPAAPKVLSVLPRSVGPSERSTAGHCGGFSPGAHLS